MVLKKIALLRSNPKDAALGRVIDTLSRKYFVECYIWDRQRDYQAAVTNGNVCYIKCGIRAGFFDLSTFLKLFLFEIWLFAKLLFAGVDCIHAIDLDTGFTGLCVAKLRGKQFVYQCLDPYYASLPKNWPRFLARVAKWLENLVITHADFFVITDLLRIPQHEGARPKRVVEIANSPQMDLSRFPGRKEKSFVVGYIGSLGEGRNLTTIIDAVGELNKEGVKLVIGGFGPLQELIREYTGRYDNVTYVPWVPYEKVIEMESAFDLFVCVMDSNSESYRWVSPNKLFESMALGKPIIVGEGTLAARRVAAVGNGLAVPYGSREDLKTAILYIRNNQDIVREMGKKGKAEFELKWRAETMEERLLSAYAALGRGGPEWS
ncbi:MAG: glycosyltransferase family 4 protein [Nitrospiraceae bacterium]|nr:glycosyltransferase family 4 protein [Nitrospiraceae bacterium]